MSFTGSPEVGRLVAAACGRNLVPVKLELGGKGAAVVFDDVNVRQTAANWSRPSPSTPARSAATPPAGSSTARSTTSFVDGLRRAPETGGRSGYQLDASTQMGPVVNQKQRDRVLGYLRAACAEGAEVRAWKGARPRCPAATAFTSSRPCWPARWTTWPRGKRSSARWPIWPRSTTRKRRSAWPTSTDYGLANSVWTSDLGRAHRVAEAMVAGNSWINAHNIFPHGVPYAGVNKSGMGGGVLSVETLLDYWRGQSIVRPL